MKKAIYSLLLTAALAGAAFASDSFGGLGISVWTGSDGVKIAGVLPNSPAESIGLQAGDLILSANGTDLSLVAPEKQVSFLRGENGSSINLIVSRNGEKLSLSTKRVSLQVQDLDAGAISAWYGKNSGLTGAEIYHLANQKAAEGYALLGIMQYGTPLLRHAENLNADAMQQVFVKKAEEVEQPEAMPVQQENWNSNASLVNAKGARTKAQNGNEKKPLAPVYRLK